jgi:hypothetical protein
MNDTERAPEHKNILIAMSFQIVTKTARHCTPKAGIKKFNSHAVIKTILFNARPEVKWKKGHTAYGIYFIILNKSVSFGYQTLCLK